MISRTESAFAIPAFARQYGISCNSCHVAYPRLNSFGEQFVADNLRMEGWRKNTTIDTGDKNLALPRTIPLAIRTQSYIQVRKGEEVDPVTGPTGNNSSIDFQAPYLVKLLSSAPLSDHITYYFYTIFADQGENGETIVEDAWFRHDNIFGTGVAMQLGQFQISELMYPREIRMPFQDYQVYRMAGITYDRGVLFDRELGPVDIALGFANGNGINANVNINSPGYKRPDNLFDNDTQKSIYGRVGTELGPLSLGLFGLAGEQKNATGTAGEKNGSRNTGKKIYGLDISGDWNGEVYWYAQALWNQWDDFLLNGNNYNWFGGFAGVDYIMSEKWVLSFLYNYADANDFDGTGTIFEGIDINSLTATASHYFMTNLKGVIEVNFDFLKKDNDADFVGHETKEDYLIVGIDAAF